MRSKVLLAAAALALAACSSNSYRGRPAPDVVVVGQAHGNAARTVGPRSVGHVPPGHYPPPGQCRLWHAGRPPGHQPAPTRCESLIGHVPAGAFVLYNAKAWDTQYDWAGHSKRNPGSVPNIVLRIVASGRR